MMHLLSFEYFLLFEFCYTKYGHILSRCMYMLKFAQFELEFLVYIISSYLNV